jgi:hypothetical protein
MQSIVKDLIAITVGVAVGVSACAALKAYAKYRTRMWTKKTDSKTSQAETAKITRVNHHWADTVTDADYDRLYNGLSNLPLLAESSAIRQGKPALLKIATWVDDPSIAQRRTRDGTQTKDFSLIVSAVLGKTETGDVEIVDVLFAVHSFVGKHSTFVLLENVHIKPATLSVISGLPLANALLVVLSNTIDAAAQSFSGMDVAKELAPILTGLADSNASVPEKSADIED